MLSLLIPMLLMCGIKASEPDSTVPVSVDLIAGQHIDVGSVDIAVGADELCITYNTVDCWYMREVHLWVGSDPLKAPQTKKGNPKIEHFPYSSEFTSRYPTTYTECIPWGLILPGDPCDQTVYIAAHAAVEKVHDDDSIQEETAWGDGEGFGGRSWAMRFSVLITCPE